MGRVGSWLCATAHKVVQGVEGVRVWTARWVICGAVKNMRVVVEPQAQTVANLPCWVRFAAEASFTKEAAAADRLTVAPMGFLRTGLTSEPGT